MGKNFDIAVNLGGKDTGAAAAVDGLTGKLRALKAEQRAERPLSKFLSADSGKQLETVAGLLGGVAVGGAVMFADAIPLSN